MSINSISLKFPPFLFKQLKVKKKQCSELRKKKENSQFSHELF